MKKTINESEFIQEFKDMGKENDDLEGYEEAVLEEIRNKTTLIMIDEDSFIIQQY